MSSCGCRALELRLDIFGLPAAAKTSAVTSSKFPTKATRYVTYIYICVHTLSIALSHILVHIVMHCIVLYDTTP